MTDIMIDIMIDCKKLCYVITFKTWISYSLFYYALQLHNTIILDLSHSRDRDRECVQYSLRHTLYTIQPIVHDRFFRPTLTGDKYDFFPFSIKKVAITFICALTALEWRSQSAVRLIDRYVHTRSIDSLAQGTHACEIICCVSRRMMQLIKLAFVLAYDVFFLSE